MSNVGKLSYFETRRDSMMSHLRHAAAVLCIFSGLTSSAACGGGAHTETTDSGVDSYVPMMDSGTACDACDVNATCTLSALPACACNAGFSGDGTTCSDIDECAVSNGGCSTLPMVVCTNTPGSHTCGTCPLGYSGDGVTCTDIDECAISNGGCSTSPMVACTNIVGSSSCAACPSGYAGDGATCTDIDECSVNNGGCSSTPLVTCHNAAGSSSCDPCPSGYNGNGLTCTDIDECTANTDGCGATQRCSNSPGSFSCVACVGSEVLVVTPSGGETCQCAGHDIVDEYTVIDTAQQPIREWQRYTVAQAWFYPDAVTYCENLTLGGKTGWRLPTRNELMAIVDYTVGTAPYTNTCAFPMMAPSPYWTSTTVVGDPTKQWVIDFSDGMAYQQPLTGMSAVQRVVLCVR